MSKEKEAAAKRVVVEYEDGSVKELDKGLVWRFEGDEDSDQVQITAELVNMTGRDLYTVVEAALELGMRLGMFNGLGDPDVAGE